MVYKDRNDKGIILGTSKHGSCIIEEGGGASWETTVLLLLSMSVISLKEADGFCFLIHSDCLLIGELKPLILKLTIEFMYLGICMYMHVYVYVTTNEKRGHNF